MSWSGSGQGVHVEAEGAGQDGTDTGDRQAVGLRQGLGRGVRQRG